MTRNCNPPTDGKLSPPRSLPTVTIVRTADWPTLISCGSIVALISEAAADATATGNIAANTADARHRMGTALISPIPVGLFGRLSLRRRRRAEAVALFALGRIEQFTRLLGAHGVRSGRGWHTA